MLEGSSKLYHIYHIITASNKILFLNLAFLHIMKNIYKMIRHLRYI